MNDPRVALGTQHALQPLQNPGFIVYKKHSPHAALVSSEHAAGLTGKRT
jgi:hypothetical protein